MKKQLPPNVPQTSRKSLPGPPFSRSDILNGLARIKKTYAPYVPFVCAGVLIGTLVYLLLMSQELVNNYDGIWHPSSFIAGDWEIALGRGLERYADRARFGVVSSVLNPVLVFLLIGAGDALILEAFGNRSKAAAYLFLFLTIVTPITGELLSYYYLAVNYELAFFFSVLSFVLPAAALKQERAAKPQREKSSPAPDARQISRKGTTTRCIPRVLLSGLALALSMALYQAYISVACILSAVFLLKLLGEKTDFRMILNYIFRVAAAIVSGGIFYLLLANALLYRAGVGLADYKGASSVSLTAILRALPATLPQCYREYFHYLFAERLGSRLEFAPLMASFVAAAFLSAAVVWLLRLRRAEKRCALGAAAVLLLSPVAACAVVIVAVGSSVTGLMAMGILLSLLTFYLLLPAGFSRGFCTAALCAAAWYMLFTVQNDQLALREGMTATVTLTQNIIHDLPAAGYPDRSDTVAFVGRAAENPLFAKSAAYETANEYAQFGKWSTDPRNNRATWTGITAKLCGTALNLCPDDLYAALISDDAVKTMPVYPNEGSIAIVRGVLVVKVSDLYQ